MAQYKHLTIIERQSIANMLANNSSLTEIAKYLNRDISTIRKEIKNHVVVKETAGYGRSYNDCANRKTCDVRFLCEACTNRSYRCNTCRQCNSRCPKFVPSFCNRSCISDSYTQTAQSLTSSLSYILFFLYQC